MSNGWWTEERVAITKGMLDRGDSQQSIAAWFGGEVNSGRINEIAKGSKPWALKFEHVKPAPLNELPPKGPYVSGYHANLALIAMSSVVEALEKSMRTNEASLAAARRAIKALKGPSNE